MRWVAKAALQKIMSALPGGQRLNYLFQRHITRNLPRRPQELVSKFNFALTHYQAARRWGDMGDQNPRSAYEFGAGWDLAAPIGLYLLGVERQVLVDLRPLLRLDLVNHTLRVYRELFSELETRAQKELRPLPPNDLERVSQLRDSLGIVYLAPRDARDSGLDGGGFDLISSTQTLEHIPQPELVPILAESRRLLAPGGIISMEVDMQDHYSYFDSGVGVYNFLGLNAGQWRLVNSGLHFQNRLRLPDYLKAAARAGLEAAWQEVSWPDENDLAQLRRMKLSAPFRGGYTLQELGARRALLVCRPAS